MTMRSLALTLALAPAALTAAPVQPTFSARREVVRVDVLVSASGQPLKGLRPSDFEVRDNGIVQAVELATFEEVPLNLILTLDMSDSVAGDRLAHLRSAGVAVLKSLTRQDRAALLTFNEAVSQPAALTGDLGLVREAIASAEGAGDTALVDGIYTSLLLGESDVGRSLVIVFSDGVDTKSWLSPDMLRAAAQSSDAVVYAVSAGKADARDLLEAVAGITGGTLFETESPLALEATFLRIINEFRHRYLISYTPTNVDAGGWHRLDVRVNRRNARVHARPGYFKER